MQRIFILSPAKTSGKRASVLMSERAQFDLALRLRGPEGAPLDDVFSFLSGLYFRGKLAYSRHFARPPAGVPGQYVITSDAGLLDPAEVISLARLRAFGDTPIDLTATRYVDALAKNALELARRLPRDCEIVLLGSIATNKYAEILLQTFGPRLAFPKDFIGRGDMSRGGLMLRAARADCELQYVSLAAVECRRGQRPPKLPREKRPTTPSRPE